MTRRRHLRRKRAIALALLPFIALSIGWSQAPASPSEREATVSAERSVRYGEKTTLRGDFPEAGRAEVAIHYRQVLGQDFKRVGTARTGPGGRWSARVKPRRSGVWRAELVSPPPADPRTDTPDSRSNAEIVRVKSVTRVAPAKRDVVAGKKFAVGGRVYPAGPRDVVVVIGGESKRVRAGSKGRFELQTKLPAPGHYKVRASAKDNSDASGSKDSGGKVTAYRYALASWYGPGFYGNRTGCGQTLAPSTRGVAHKSLPCGTKLSIRNGSREIEVRVIDRGPYVGDREFDLTEATKNDLGFSGTGQILVSR